MKKNQIQQPKRFLKNIVTGTVWTWTEQLAKNRSKFIEISKAEAMYRLGKGPKPAGISMLENIPESLVNIISKLDPAQMGQLEQLGQAISAGGAISPAPAQELADTPLAPPVTLAPPVVDDTPLAPPEKSLSEDLDEMNEVLTPDLEANIESDPVTSESLKKPVNKMTKPELEVYALSKFGLTLDSDDLTKKEMLLKIKEAEA